MKLVKYYYLLTENIPVKVSYPLKQGLKPNAFFFNICKEYNVKVSYPLKQGLKLICMD